MQSFQLVQGICICAFFVDLNLEPIDSLLNTFHFQPAIFQEQFALSGTLFVSRFLRGIVPVLPGKCRNRDDNHCNCQQDNKRLLHGLILRLAVSYLTVYQNLALRTLPSLTLNLHITPYLPFFERSKSAPK